MRTVKSWLLLAALSAVTTVALQGTARADERSGILDSRHHKYESPQHFALEFRFSPYKPDVDSEPSLGGKTPYKDTFGSMARLLFALEFDWQAFRIPHLGTLGPGVSVGSTTMTAKARLTNHPDQLSAEDTSLDIYPFYGVAVFRADAVMRDLHIPFVPYAKAGFAYALWRASNTLGTSTGAANAADPTGATIVGKGHTFGEQLAAGVAFSMNSIDFAAARNLDNNMGINNTSLFFEMMYASYKGLGQKNAMYVGATTWTMGLTFEF